MYINVEEPTRSVRSYRRDGREYLILSGESHKPGDDPDEAVHWDHLAAWGQEHFGTGATRYRWSAQDYTPLDGLPYVGKLSRPSRSLWTATGFRKWGMTGGTAAAMVLAALVLGEDHPWAGVLDANRVTPKASSASFVKENLDVARHFVSDRLALPGQEAVDALGPGEGAVVRLGSEAYAVSRDVDGTVRSVSPVCTHLACHVRWNTAERSWDCPCHGSRFSADGVVVQGPAVRDLDDKTLP